MKNYLILIVFFCLNAKAQVTITQTDMPSAGDTLRYSVAANAILIQPGSSGANQTWDFTNLSSSSQFVDTFLSISQTPFTYLFVFGLFGNAASDMGRLDNSAFQLPSIQGISISDVYNFYKKNSSSFSQKGFGASISGFPIPIPYSDPDVLFPLPLTSSSTNSSAYSYQISIPTLGYYGRNAVRNNEVDGYGTLKTPFGEFQTLRLRSELVSNDSVAIDTLGIGFAIPAQTEVRYKWVAPNYGWPLLEITANSLFGIEIVSRVIYRDNPPIVQPNGMHQMSISSVNVYPNPSTDVLVVNTQLSLASNLKYTLFNSLGKSVYELTRKQSNAGENIEFIPLSTLQLSSGVYFMRIDAGNGASIYKTVIVDNQNK
jgi:hypothetical protein